MPHHQTACGTSPPCARSIADRDRFTYNAPFATGREVRPEHHGTERRRGVDVGGLFLTGPRTLKGQAHPELVEGLRPQHSWSISISSTPSARSRTKSIPPSPPPSVTRRTTWASSSAPTRPRTSPPAPS